MTHINNMIFIFNKMGTNNTIITTKIVATQFTSTNVCEKLEMWWTM
jgi:hypothetical protein